MWPRHGPVPLVDAIALARRGQGGGGAGRSGPRQAAAMPYPLKSRAGPAKRLEAGQAGVGARQGEDPPRIGPTGEDIDTPAPTKRPPWAAVAALCAFPRPAAGRPAPPLGVRTSPLGL